MTTTNPQIKTEEASKIHSLLEKGDKTNISLAYEMNKGLKILSDYDFILAKQCKYSMLAYRVLIMIGEDVWFIANKNYPSETDISYFEDTDRIEFLINTDFTGGAITLDLKKSSPIKRVVYDRGEVELHFSDIELRTSNQDCNVNWSYQRITNYFSLIDKAFNIDIERLLDSNNNELPF